MVQDDIREEHHQSHIFMLELGMSCYLALHGLIHITQTENNNLLCGSVASKDFISFLYKALRSYTVLNLQMWHIPQLHVYQWKISPQKIVRRKCPIV